MWRDARFMNYFFGKNLNDIYSSVTVPGLGLSKIGLFVYDEKL